MNRPPVEWPATAPKQINWWHPLVSPPWRRCVIPGRRIGHEGREVADRLENIY